jgi:hypothetical protein
VLRHIRRAVLIIGEPTSTAPQQDQPLLDAAPYRIYF